ncbi:MULTISPECIES: DUF3987 domain-containing protein [Halorhodospira]|uniref:DUF3987 domain-containing protein n=1 Tax=Halorhodospira TaxID=85108 RepID=UPI001EE7F95A|nr:MULTISPECIES: DUF3987 domain-containing protein [Halorhodospira]MCG5527342.1 DUF3987 domain-containing protein [Halorhodospira halophila]MCG5543664.1 DUF3987 domain-containing protein [Halorhodospira sp. 9628]
MTAQTIEAPDRGQEGCARLKADRDELRRFVQAMLCNATEGHISLRAFDGNDKPAGRWRSPHVGDLGAVAEQAAELAEAVANESDSAVFCPPVATFKTEHGASEGNLCQGVALSVDLDENDPAKGAELLQRALGESTQDVASGGEWIDPATGEIQPKRHLHWRLTEPATTPEEHAELKRLRRLAVALTGGDGSAAPLVHPLRWPGSWHLKGEPRQCRVIGGNPEREISLQDAAEWLDAAAELQGIDPSGFKPKAAEKATQGAPQGGGDLLRVAKLLNEIPNDERHYDDWLKVGMAVHHETGGSSAGLALWEAWSMKASKHDPAQMVKKWQSFSQREGGYTLGTLVHMAQEAETRRALESADDDGVWPEPADIFSSAPVPPFPSHVLPESWQRHTNALSLGSGFDAGAYQFTMMVHAGCMLDHRVRVRINGQWKQPPFHWAALVDDSGGGKSPVLNAAGAPAMSYYSEVSRQSARAYADWAQRAAEAKKGEEPPRPAWKQRHADDTTVEGMSDLVAENPEGVTLALDELTGWLGRMDAYSNSGSASKDRPAWIDAWGGREDKPINRASRKTVIVPHWAAGVIGAIQPDILANQFKKGQGSGDGLLQRFMLYKMRPAGDPDLLAEHDVMAQANASRVFHTLADMAQNHVDGPPEFSLSRDAVGLLQEYLTAIRTIVERSNSVRFREHVNKFPAFAARVALTLHYIHAAAAEREPSEVIGAETMRHALDVMRVLYRHSEAVYAVMDNASSEAQTLARSAAEAILANKWKTVKRGDLTRQATGWRGADARDSEAAVDLLVELGWWWDRTEEPKKRRGRRSDGYWIVNPLVHERFQTEGERIKAAREERRRAIEHAAAERRAEKL